MMGLISASPGPWKMRLTAIFAVVSKPTEGATS
jgi:hypothetical protein